MEMAVLAREAELRALQGAGPSAFPLQQPELDQRARDQRSAAQAREMCILLAEFFRKTPGPRREARASPWRRSWRWPGPISPSRACASGARLSVEEGDRRGRARVPPAPAPAAAARGERDPARHRHPRRRRRAAHRGAARDGAAHPRSASRTRSIRSAAAARRGPRPRERAPAPARALWRRAPGVEAERGARTASA